MLKKNLTLKHVLIAISLLGLGAAGHYTWRLYQKQLKVQPLPNLQVAFVDLSRIHEDSLAYKKFKELIERQYKQFHDDIHVQEKNIREQYEKLKNQPFSTEEEGKILQGKKEKLNHEFNELDKKIRQHKESLNDDFAKIKEKLEKTTLEIIRSLAKKRRLNLVLNGKSKTEPLILYGSEQLDMTDSVLIELNKKVPTVQLK